MNCKVENIEVGFCGKSCSACDEMKAKHCAGCKAGTGCAGESCELGKCCRGKSQESCDVCSQKEGCWRLQRRDRQPELRKEAAQNRRYLGKWLWILFLVNLVGNIDAIWFGKTVIELSTLKTASAVTIGVILFVLSSKEERYRIAGVFALTAVAVDALGVLLGAGFEVLLKVILIPIALLRDYFQFTAHASVLESVDDKRLPPKWEFLWKCKLCCKLAQFASLLLGLISPGLRDFVDRIAAVALAVVTVMVLVRLYQTAKRLKNPVP